MITVTKSSATQTLKILSPNREIKAYPVWDRLFVLFTVFVIENSLYLNFGAAFRIPGAGKIFLNNALCKLNTNNL